MIVNDVIVFLDREQGGQQNLVNKKLNLYSVVTMTSLLEFLKLEKFLDEEMLQKVETFIKSNNMAEQKTEVKGIATYFIYPKPLSHFPFILGPNSARIPQQRKYSN